MSIKKSEVLTIDATIITGILILLTISNFVEFPSALYQSVINVYIKAIILGTIAPFALSAMHEIKESITAITNNEEASKKGLKLMRIGFGYLVMLVALIVIGQTIGVVINDLHLTSDE